MSKTALYLIYFCTYSLILLVIGKGSLRGNVIKLRKSGLRILRGPDFL